MKTMRNNCLLFLGLIMVALLFSCAGNKSSDHLQVEIHEVNLDGVPAVNSYAFAVDQANWLIVGGRIDGLHDHRPDRAYPADKSNQNLWVIDPVKNKTWKKSLEGLSANLFEQLQSTNMSFYQDGDKLLLIGGYGWSEQAQDYLTFPFLTIVDVPKLIEAIQSNADIQAFFKQIENEQMAVSGGYSGKIGDDYLLVFGNRFDGRYSAHPNDGHKQQYTNEIRKFRLKVQNGATEITDFSAIRDSANFHRRDFNMLPQIFPDGDFGYTAFSGVFQYDRNFPWPNPVNIFSDGYEAIQDFGQKFSSYHSTCVGVYSKNENRMDNLFFGGMARYFPDPKTGEITNDPLVPSVNTVSMVSRFSDGSLNEEILEIKMPGLLGASANFIPAANVPLLHHKIVDFDKLPSGKILIGFSYGGLESTEPNIFLRPSGESHSTNRVFEIYLIKN